MVWGLRAPVWFGIMLAALALFAWCLLARIERSATLAEGEVISAGYIWGFVIFGAIAIAAAVLAFVAFFSDGQVVRARDALTQATSKPPRMSSGRSLAGSGLRPRGSGDTPRPSSGRKLR